MNYVTNHLQRMALWNAIKEPIKNDDDYIDKKATIKESRNLWGWVARAKVRPLEMDLTVENLEL